MKKYSKYLNLIFLILSVIFLVAIEKNHIGAFFFGIGLISLIFCEKTFAKNILLVYISIAILAITPIGTTTDPPKSIFMGLGILSVVLIPYLVTKKIYKNNFIKFPVLGEKAWNKSRIFYLFFTAFACYLILPIMLRSTDSYPNWEVQTDAWDLFVSYIGLNIVGIWDELFFVCTVLAILQRFYPFWIANIAQATLFTSFLFSLAFIGWSPLLIFPFALLQGYIFKKTKSLLFILAIHLTVDLVLHLTIVYLNHPEFLPIFIT